MWKRLASLAAGVAAAVVLAAAGSGVAPAFAKSCPSGFTPGKIDGQWKCLHAGEYCDRTDENEYQHYYFKCVVVNGTYRLEHS